MTNTSHEHAVIEFVTLGDLDGGGRLRPPDADHVLALSQVLDECPPITAHRGTMRLVDGHMRADAAHLLGRCSLPVVWIDGDDASLLEAAVSANSRHGLPLTHLQRKDAARKLLTEAPHWSTRRVARACGLPEATVRRMRPPASLTQVDRRVGSDGKAYPIRSSAHQQSRALLGSAPELSDRAIARATGLSPTTIGRLRRESEPPDHTKTLRARALSVARRVLGTFLRLFFRS
jgi:ParB-like chromosome segregation protein Spo0J